MTNRLIENPITRETDKLIKNEYNKKAAEQAEQYEYAENIVFKKETVKNHGSVVFRRYAMMMVGMYLLLYRYAAFSSSFFRYA